MDYKIPTTATAENVSPRKRAAMGMIPQRKPNISPANVPSPMVGVTGDMGSDD